MATNEQILKEVSTLAEHFETRPDSELLRNAYQKLETIRPYMEQNPVAKLKIRASTSALWIRLLNLIDAHLPADFDPEKTVSLKPEFPQGPDGMPKYPPGTDPQTIKDPQERSAYMKTVSDHRKAQEGYRLSMHLYNLNEQLTESARNYFVLAYLGTKPEQQEFKSLLETGIKRADRKTEFLKFVRL